MDVREALYTTRAMRRVKPDPIPADVQMRILDAAIRAPSGGNSQNWHFLLVDDPAVRGKLGPIYRDCMSMLWKTIYKQRLDAMEATPNDPESIQFRKVYNSANWLAENFETYPLLLMGFAQSDPSGGSIYPALWNAMLAARAEGVGSALTSVILFKWPEVKAILGVPDDTWNFAGCVTMGYPTGRWGVAPRRPVHEVSSRNSWTGALGFEIPEPLWPPK
ncbi:MAG: nitroreductase family protein [Myxococcota bacterium]|nr:nitroreductase family protein [Myxococcales bacterium]